MLQATALNMVNMIGIGPFITIPLLMSAMGGPQAMLGWAAAMVLVIFDGMVWSELGASMPGTGGSYVYLREGYGHQTWGRLMAFLFIWQFIFSGPLEIASGYIGFASYLGYTWTGLKQSQVVVIGAAVGILNVILLYRHIGSIGKITVSLWIGTILTAGAVIVSGLLHFNPRVAFDFPPDAFRFSWGFVWGLGASARIGIYDYLGYYDICYLGGEVKNPGRVIPRSVILSVVVVALLYFAINLSVIGVVPWREFVPAEMHHNSGFIVSVFMEKLYGRPVATVFTAMVLWTAFGSVFALLLGYSRIPYAAAQDGYFFRIFGRLHPQKSFPHVSLVVIGLISIGCAFLPLGAVIDALLISRILVQFMGQVGAVALLRKRRPDMERPYRIWLYPLPTIAALLGWLFVFCTSGGKTISFGLGTLVLGIVVFLIWSWQTHRWPFRAQALAVTNEQ